MDHHEHNPGDHEDPLVGSTWMVGFLGAVLLIVIVLGLTALYYTAAGDEFERKVADQTAEEVLLLNSTQELRLTSEARREIDMLGEEEVERIVIPIDDASKLIIAEYGDASRQ